MNIAFGCDNPEELLDQARMRAVADARRKAELYVKGAGASLGVVVSISEGQAMPFQQFRYEHLAAGSADALPIAAGQQSLNVSVTVTYTINNNLPAVRS
jgi:uncharacterized protein YggE